MFEDIHVACMHKTLWKGPALQGPFHYQLGKHHILDLVLILRFFQDLFLYWYHQLTNI